MTMAGTVESVCLCWLGLGARLNGRAGSVRKRVGGGGLRPGPWEREELGGR